jgi:hypothetical protein
MRRSYGTAARVGLVLLAGATLVHSGPARAQEVPASTIGGFEGTGAASGLRAVYNPEGILPIAPPLDLGSPDALATIATGPSTFARASMADPGDLLANPDALFSAGSEDYPQGAIPPYPFRITASSGTGAPTARSAPAPGFDAAVTATESGSQAEATTPKVSAPAILTVGSMRTRAATHTDGSKLVVEARASLSDFDLLGLLTIKSVSTDLTVTSNGRVTETSGGTVVTGASFGGQPVTIDSQGIHPEKGAGAAERAEVTALNEVLSALGLRVTAAGPIKQESPTAGQVISAGLRVDLEVSDRTYPQIGELLDQLPPLPALIPGAPGPDDLIVLARARHLLTIGVAQASVSLGVRPAVEYPVIPVDESFEVPPDVSVALPEPVALGPGPAPAQPVVSTPIGNVEPDEAPSLGFAEGIGLLAVLGLVLQSLIADRISRGAAALLATDALDTCPWEGT